MFHLLIPELKLNCKAVVSYFRTFSLSSAWLNGFVLGNRQAWTSYQVMAFFNRPPREPTIIIHKFQNASRTYVLGNQTTVVPVGLV